MIRHCWLLCRNIRLLCRGIRYEIGRLIEEQREREVPPLLWRGRGHSR